MNLVQAKCTNCGAVLEVDSKKDAAICPFCGSAYIVERAVANFYGNNTTHIVADTVNIINNEVYKSEASVNPRAIGTNNQLINKIQLCSRFDGSIQMIDTVYNVLYLKGDGTIGWCSQNPDYSNDMILNWDVEIFTWKNIKKFLTIRFYDSYCVVALTFDGKCLVSKPSTGGINNYTFLKICHSQSNRYEQVSKWTNIADIVYSGNDVFGVTSDGTVRSTNDSFNTEMWHDIKKIGSIGVGLYGITSSEKVKLFGCTNLKQYQADNISKWEGIVCLNKYYLGLTQKGTVLSSEIDDPGYCNLKNVANMDYEFIHTDGSVTIFHHNRFKHLGQVGLGYVQALYDYFGCLLLNQDGRVDEITDLGEIKYRGRAENVIHMFFLGTGQGYLYLNNDGTFWHNRRVFLPDYVNQYGIEPSPGIQNDTKTVILEELNKRKDFLAKRKRELPLLGSARKNCKERIDEIDYEIAMATQKL